ncbi:hypothetical protein ACWC09_50530 [Streptomyces sp. NPDC001617]
MSSQHDVPDGPYATFPASSTSPPLPPTGKEAGHPARSHTPLSGTPEQYHLPPPRPGQRTTQILHGRSDRPACASV